MAFSANLADGYLPNTVSNDTIPQFRVVCIDTTASVAGSPIYVVLPGTAHAGPVAGVNEDTGIDTNFIGGVGQSVLTGQACRVACRRVAKVQAKSGETIAIGVAVYAAAGDPGTITATSSSNKFVGTSLEASAGGTADIISVLVHALGGV